MLRWPWIRRKTSPNNRQPSVTPRALTLGVYLDALIAAGVDEGEVWAADTAPVASCLAVLDALCDEVVFPVLDAAALREQAARQWERLLAEYHRGRTVAHALRLEAEEAVGEGLEPSPPPGRLSLLRAAAALSPEDRAAALAEPLVRGLVFAEVGALQRQASEATRRALESARLN